MTKEKMACDTTLHTEMGILESPKQIQCICKAKISFPQHK